MVDRIMGPRLGCALMVGLAAVAAVVLLRARRVPEDYVGKWTASLQERTVPPGGALSVESAAERSGAFVEVRWEFETGMPWEDYRKWTTARLTPDYEVGESAAAHLRFKKQLAGDAHEVRVERLSGELPLRIRVVFVSYAF